MFTTDPTRSTHKAATGVGLAAVILTGVVSALAAGALPAAADQPSADATPVARSAATQIVARSTCVIKGHTFELVDHETPADAHGRHTGDIDFYAPGGTVSVTVTDRGGIYHSTFGTTITPLTPGWHHLARYYRVSVGSPLSYRFTWTPSFISGTGSCGNSFCGPYPFLSPADTTQSRAEADLMRPMGGC